jgi:sigma-B regulation protein RsbU (phosphoserine phosphatase)
LLPSQLLDGLIADPKPHALPAGKFDPNVCSLLSLQSTDTVLLFPLVVHNEVLGLFMQIDSDPYVEAPPEQMIGRQKYAILEGIAQQAAVSLQNINLINAKQNEAYISRVLLHFSRILGSASSLSQGFSQITSEVTILSGLESFAIIDITQDGEKITLRYLNTESLPLHRIKNIIGLSTETKNLPELDELSSKSYALKPGNWFHTMKPLRKFFASNEVQEEQPSASSDESALIIFPLRIRGLNYGYMAVRDRHAADRNLRIELLTGLAQQLSSAIMNNQLKQIQDEQEKTNREFSLARQIQKTFLPEVLPELAGYETSVRWQTALQVGGDFYDLFPLRDNLFGIVIADVSDKGLAAALYMTVSRTLIRATSLETTSPATTLERVNHLLQIDSQQGFFVTTFYGVLDLTSNVLTYCNAGHNPPLYYDSATKLVRQLERGGIALGVIDTINLPEYQLNLNSGDGLYLFTDGVTEGTSAGGDFYGLTRPMALLEQFSHRSTEEILEAILEDQAKFRGDSPFSDDVTQMILKRL